jgi:hypothetical protein
MTLSPYMNTSVKMPKAMFDALQKHEITCCVTNVKSVTEDDVRSFLRTHYNDKMAESFKPSYLFSTQEP